jgi:plastocyanin
MKLLIAAALALAPGIAVGATVDVAVGPGLSFTPASVAIAPGDTIRWVWAGALHTSTSNTNSGPEVWNSGSLSTGNFSHTFNTAGDWPYYCAIHSVPGGTAMNAVVHVAAPVATPGLSPKLLVLLIAALAIAGALALKV